MTGKIIRLMLVVLFFAWRMDAWAETRNQWDGIMALVWLVFAVALAYGIVHAGDKVQP